MKVRELRIGNLISVFDNQIAEISEINWNGCWVKLLEPEYMQSKDHDISRNSLEPIPLTEEWLINFGFSKINESEYRHTEYFYNFKKGWFGICEGVGMEIVFDMKYVHQLQNLYFALTGEELTLNGE